MRGAKAKSAAAKKDKKAEAPSAAPVAVSRVHTGSLVTYLETASSLEPRTEHVELVNPVVDRTTGTFKVTLAVDNSDGSLRPGTFARIRLETSHVQNALLLPAKSILTEDGATFVFAAGVTARCVSAFALAPPPATPCKFSPDCATVIAW